MRRRGRAGKVMRDEMEGVESSGTGGIDGVRRRGKDKDRRVRRRGRGGKVMWMRKKAVGRGGGGKG